MQNLVVKGWQFFDMPKRIKKPRSAKERLECDVGVADHGVRECHVVDADSKSLFDLPQFVSGHPW